MSGFDAKYNKALQLTARSHASQVNLSLQLEYWSRAAAEGHQRKTALELLGAKGKER